MKTPIQTAARVQQLEPAAPSLRNNTLWMFAGRSLRIVVQAAYFVLLARSLGVSQYGAFIAAAGFAGILFPFASLGAGNLLIKQVARDRSKFPRCWGQALAITTVSGIVLSLVGILASPLILPKTVPASVTVPLILAELLFTSVLDVSGQAYMALEMLRQTAGVWLGLSVSRMLAAATLMAFFHHPSASVWADLYLASTVVAAVVASFAVTRQIGKPLLAFSWRPREILDGFYFSVSLSAQTVYNDIDKTMLARLSGLAPAGLYGAAYRIVDVACTPLGAMLAASYTRFFQHGEKGLRFSVRFAHKLLPRTVVFGVCCSLSLMLGAPLMSPVLGRQYAAAATALRWLAPIVLLRCIHYLGANAMSGGDVQGLRCLIQMTVAIVNVFLNLFVLPRYSWQGAVGTSLACDVLLAVLIWSAIWWRLAPEAPQLSPDVSRRNIYGAEVPS